MRHPCTQTICKDVQNLQVFQENLQIWLIRFTFSVTLASNVT